MDRERGATLTDYRAKYALYRARSSCRKVHARFPMVTIWDDHEVRTTTRAPRPAAGSTRARAVGGAPQRRLQGLFEAMPNFALGHDRIYRSERHGSTVDLILLTSASTAPTSRAATRSRRRARSWDQPRPFLGRQRRWTGSRSACAAPRRAGRWSAPNDDDAGEGHGGRSSSSTPGRAIRASARSCSPTSTTAASTTSSSSPATSTCSSPATCVPDGRRRSVAVEFVGGSITSTTSARWISTPAAV